MNTAGFAVTQHQISANSQSIRTHFVTKCLPPAITCFLIDERAVKLSKKLDSSRSDDSIEGIAERVGKLSERNELDGLGVKRRTACQKEYDGVQELASRVLFIVRNGVVQSIHTRATLSTLHHSRTYRSPFAPTDRSHLHMNACRRKVHTISRVWISQISCDRR